MKNIDEFVYVNQDGSVRELSCDERQFLSQKLHPGDSGRPYIKSSYKSKDGWGSISGFFLRRKIPRHVIIEPVNPEYSYLDIDVRRQAIEDGKLVGDVVIENPDGSVSCTPNPDISKKKRFELYREIQLERQNKREQLAKHPDYVKGK